MSGSVLDPSLGSEDICIALDPLTGDRHMTSSIPLLFSHPHHLLFIFYGGRRWNMVWDSRTGLPAVDGTSQIGVLTIPGYQMGPTYHPAKHMFSPLSHTLTPLVPFSVTSSSLSFRYLCRYHYQKEILTLPSLTYQFSSSWCLPYHSTYHIIFQMINSLSSP